VPTLHAWRQADPEGLGGRLGGVFPEDPGLAMAGPAGQRVWMALQGGATPTATGPLGAALLEADDDPHQAWVFIAIAPDRRGCGWGRLLLGAVAEAARRQGLARLLAAGGAEWAAPAALRCAYASGFTAAGGAVLRLALT
jgi:GNAT superfamily N-acetyltransferase